METINISTGTVPYEIKVKYKSAIIMLHPASE
jgi:ribosomal protein S5